MATEDLKPLLERHEAFWNGEGEEPLIRVTPHVPLQDKGSVPLTDGSRAAEGAFISPDAIDPARFYGKGRGPDAARNGDFLAGVSPPHLCWTEAILGCPVRIVTGGPWAEPFVEDVNHPGALEPDERWLAKLDQFVDYLGERAGGRHAVVQPLMRGPVDMMASAVGHEPMCLALMESPEATDAYLAHCAEVFILAAARRLEHTPVFHGGYLSSYGIWAPGTVVRTQLDNATMLSPDLYRDRVLEHERRVMEAFDYALIHVHSGCLHIVDPLLTVDALRIIQVSVDYPGGPLASEILPLLEKILQHKSLILTGPVTQAELDDLRALPQQGRLCIQVQLVDEHGG